jgi:two-component system response regulator AtoC
LSYAWKGNVREVRNAVERISLLEEGDTLLPEHLHSISSTGRMIRSSEPTAESDEHNGFQLPAEGVILDDLNKDLIQQALEMTGGNQVRAAKLLGLIRGTLAIPARQVRNTGLTPRPDQRSSMIADQHAPRSS